MLPLLVVGNILHVSQSSSMKMLATKTTLDTFKGSTGFAITLPDRGHQFDGISVCLRYSLFECLDFQPLFGNSQFVLYQSGPHGLGVMQRKVIFSPKNPKPTNPQTSPFSLFDRHRLAVPHHFWWTSFVQGRGWPEEEENEEYCWPHRAWRSLCWV